MNVSITNSVARRGRMRRWEEEIEHVVFVFVFCFSGRSEKVSVKRREGGRKG